MKLRIASSVFLFSLSTLAYAAPAPLEEAIIITPGTFYIGVLGGGGWPNHVDASQFGTAFITEAAGGPLAVNAFGQLNKPGTGFFGVQLGYQAQDIFLNSSEWTLTPAAELEGYYMTKSTFDGTLVNNTLRLDEHDFVVSYPMERTVFLANAVLGFNSPCFALHPYIGLGVGNALVKISHANSLQVNPPEGGINHYNSKRSDTSSTFAGQAKVGLNYDLSEYVSLFAEYRWLYIANIPFVFGSTVFPTHVETTSWQVKLDSQKYNLGNIGIRFSW